MEEATPTTIRALNWHGSIPIILTLAPSSLSSPTMPPPQHRLVSRMTYLHIGLSDAVRRLAKFAPPTIMISGSGNASSPPLTPTSSPTKKKSSDVVVSSNDDEGNDNATNDETTNNNKENPTNQNDPSNDNTTATNSSTNPFPICWFEDDTTGTPLRWHLFTGILYDLTCKQQHQKSSALLPWTIRVHFTSYPHHVLLPLHDRLVDDDPLVTIRRYFSNSLKQSLYLQSGSSKVAMAMSKTVHDKLWDCVIRSNYDGWGEVSRESLGGGVEREFGGEDDDDDGRRGRWWWRGDDSREGDDGW